MPKILRGAANAASLSHSQRRFPPRSPSSPAPTGSASAAPANRACAHPGPHAPTLAHTRRPSQQARIANTSKEPPMTDEQFRKTQRKLRNGLAQMARRKLRDMRRRATRPRTLRLKKEARILKSLIAEARAAGLV